MPTNELILTLQSRPVGILIGWILAGSEPDVVVGSSRGGAVAINIDSKNTPLVLLCPAWKNWGTAMNVKPNSVILHSEHDDVVSIEDSRELLLNSGLPESELVVVGHEHRLADEESLGVMLEACERLANLHARQTLKSFFLKQAIARHLREMRTNS